MKVKAPLSPASQRPSLRHFEQSVFPLAMSKWGSFSSVFLRLALGLSFLSAVADRFGLWGQFGQPNVSWGTFSRFVEYTGRLTSYLPPRMTRTLAVISTGAEILFGLLLLVGWHTHCGSVRWNSPNGIRIGDGTCIGSEGAFGLLRLFGGGRGLASSRMRKFSIQRGWPPATPIALNTKDEDGIALSDPVSNSADKPG
jgi:hypothetical protein